MTSGQRVINSLDEVAELIENWQDERELYVRWTDDVQRDVVSEVSRDELTGMELPGLSANSLHVEPWWSDRPLRTWVARRLYDYRHLPEIRGEGTVPWILAGIECGRGPDNEPLIGQCTPIAEVQLQVIDAATDEIRRIADDWGTMRRT